MTEQWWVTESSCHSKGLLKRKTALTKIQIQKSPPRAESGLSVLAAIAVQPLPSEPLASASSDFWGLSPWPPLRVLEQSQHPLKERAQSTNGSPFSSTGPFMQGRGRNEYSNLSALQKQNLEKWDISKENPFLLQSCHLNDCGFIFLQIRLKPES